MECTEKMLLFAMEKAVEVGLIQKSAIGDKDCMHRIKAVIDAALSSHANTPPTSVNSELLNALIKLREDAYNAYADSSCNEAFERADAAIAKASISSG